MGTLAGVGYSVHKNPHQAGREAALTALSRGGMERPDFVFAFATVGYDQAALIGAIREATGGAPLSGCSGEGIIAHGVMEESNFAVCVLAISSDELRFANARVRDLADGYDRAGDHLAAEVRPLIRDDAVACFLFVDGLVFDFDPFKDAFERALSLDRPLPLFGGLAADNWATRTTFQYHDAEVFSEGISCVVMSGSARMAWGVDHGCVPVGTRRTVTRSKGNVIYEIDGIPALQVLMDYLENGGRSQWNKVSLNLCLGFRAPEQLKEEYGDFVIRYVMDKNDEAGSVTIQSDVDQGTDLWIMRRDKELMREGLEAIGRQIHARLGEHVPKLVLQFECVGRGRVVYREQEKVALLRTLQQEVGAEAPWVGFFSYGEIGPVSGFNCIHNFTSVVVAVY